MNKLIFQREREREREREEEEKKEFIKSTRLHGTFRKKKSFVRRLESKLGGVRCILFLLEVLFEQCLEVLEVGDLPEGCQYCVPDL